jgi:hypothetical protein
MKTRTKRQIDADKLDLAIFNVVGDLARFGNEYRDEDVHKMADILDGLRGRVRRHMHDEDLAATSG